ncbi:hypothetical protein ACFSTH_11290 [Paenibacillus yanchengensis]|uniref:Uncharacterized protein n=1 Tax=Paenibacillus yanchengensis TaxID=2035833 RepID=A0ABW4YJK9_9BACL
MKGLEANLFSNAQLYNKYVHWIRRPNLGWGDDDHAKSGIAPHMA